MPSDSTGQRIEISSIRKFLAGAVILTFGAVHYGHMSRSTQGHFLQINQDGVPMQANVSPIRVFNAGELSTHIPLITQLEVWDETWDQNPLNPSQATLGGKSTNQHFFDQDGKPERPGICLVRTFAPPYGNVSPGEVFEFTDTKKSPVIYPQRETFYAVKTHEIYHCIYNYAEGHNIEDPDGFAWPYISSVMETAADLGMALHYASQTGTFDIWDDLMRPDRLIGNHSKHLDHQTAWAMDILLADVNPTSVFGKTPEQVSEILILLMSKHFESQGMIVNPDLPGAPITPAMRAVLDELAATRELALKAEGKPPEGAKVDPLLIKRLRQDISISLARNHREHMFNLTDAQSRDYTHRAEVFSKKWGIEYRADSYLDVRQPTRQQQQRQNYALEDLVP